MTVHVQRHECLYTRCLCPSSAPRHDKDDCAALRNPVSACRVPCVFAGDAQSLHKGVTRLAQPAPVVQLLCIMPLQQLGAKVPIASSAPPKPSRRVAHRHLCYATVPGIARVYIGASRTQHRPVEAAETELATTAAGPLRQTGSAWPVLSLGTAADDGYLVYASAEEV